MTSDDSSHPPKRKVHFEGSALSDLKKHPEKVVSDLFQELDDAAQGKMPGYSRSMKTVGKGVLEARIKNARVIYKPTKDRVYVLHAFKKQSKKARTKDIKLAKRRLKAVHGTR